MDSTAMPRSLISSPSATGSPSMGANSWSHDSSTFMRDHLSGRGMAAASELLQEADVVAEHVADVVDAVAHERQPVGAEAEREARPDLRVVADRGEHVGVHHAAAPELEPAGLAARATARPLAEQAVDVVLGGRL